MPQDPKNDTADTPKTPKPVKLPEPISTPLRCNCGCGLVVVDEYPEDGTVALAYYELGFYANQNNPVRRYFRRLWSAIRGRTFEVFDILVTQDEWDAFIRKLG